MSYVTRWKGLARTELVRRASDNPFAVLALARLATHRRGSGPERKARKADIIALLYRYRYERDTARKRLPWLDRVLTATVPREPFDPHRTYCDRPGPELAQ